jgi:hypothetical protein
MKPKFTYVRNEPKGSGPVHIDKYDYDRDEVLHKQGEWFIRKSPVYEDTWKSYIHHRVEKNIVQQNPWVNGKPPEPRTYLKKVSCNWSDLPLIQDRCTKCMNKIPEGVKALWVMHNWDALQKGEYLG